MRPFLTILFCAAITLWLGGLVALFIFVQALFKTDRAIAVNAAPILFKSFEFYQLVLVVLALVSLIAWRLLACSTAKRWIMVLVIAASIGAVIETAVISRRMHEITAAGAQRDNYEFKRLHGYSMIIYSTETILLAAAACLLPAAIKAEAELRPRTSPRTAPV